MVPFMHGEVARARKKNLKPESAETLGMFLWMILKILFVNMGALRWGANILKPKSVTPL
jgi:hypothetical protein